MAAPIAGTTGTDKESTLLRYSVQGFPRSANAPGDAHHNNS